MSSKNGKDDRNENECTPNVEIKDELREQLHSFHLGSAHSIVEWTNVE
mgnify:FL=1